MLDVKKEKENSDSNLNEKAGVYMAALRILCSDLLEKDSNCSDTDRLITETAITYGYIFYEFAKKISHSNIDFKIINADMSIYLTLYISCLIKDDKLTKQLEYNMIKCLTEIFCIDKLQAKIIFSNRSEFFNTWFREENFIENYLMIIEKEITENKFTLYSDNMPITLTDIDFHFELFNSFVGCMSSFVNRLTNSENTNTINEQPNIKKTNSNNKNGNEIKTDKELVKKVIAIFAAFIIFCVCTLLVTFFGDNFSGNSQTTTTANVTTTQAEPSTTEMLPIVRRPESGEILINSALSLQSEITIVNSSSDCYVKLKDPYLYDEFGFYVRAYDTVTIKVPAGYYYVYFASGATWYGTQHLFGDSTLCSKDENIQDFNNYSYTYTLKEIRNGNFNPEDVSIEEFK